MKIGDLVQCSHLNVGIITKRSKGMGRTRIWRVHWVTGESYTIHEKFLEVINENR